MLLLLLDLAHATPLVSPSLADEWAQTVGMRQGHAQMLKGLHAADLGHPHAMELLCGPGTRAR